MEKERVTFTVNGAARQVQVGPRTTLLDVLREELGLSGTKNGCGQGHCGACTVIVDGEAVRSCVYLGRRAERPAVTRDNLIENNEIAGYGMRSHCIMAAPGIALRDNRIERNRCGEAESRKAGP